MNARQKAEGDEKNDVWINLFLFFLITDKPAETVLGLIQSDNCEEEFANIVKMVAIMDSKQFQHNCIDWLMKHKEKLIELNKTYKTSLKALEAESEEEDNDK